LRPLPQQLQVLRFTLFSVIYGVWMLNDGGGSIIFDLNLRFLDLRFRDCCEGEGDFSDFAILEGKRDLLLAFGIKVRERR
jgi:hypothetical protein